MELFEALDKPMRHFIPLITACSGFALATAWVAAPSVQFASAAEIKFDTRVAVASPSIEKSSAAPTKVMCSRRPIALNGSTDSKTATLPQHLSFASNIVELFCRDVRINTIVVRDYCAVIRG